MSTAAERLRQLLDQPQILTMPGCHDAMSAKLIQQAGFDIGFMSGFAVSVARLGLPDTGLISFGEMLDQGRNICSAVGIPMTGDGDTGFGNALKEMAAANIFAGDLLYKNFGVTRHGRVIFYDYDEIEFMTDMNFRRIPEPRTPEDEARLEVSMSSSLAPTLPMCGKVKVMIWPA